jgi:hypothetical protein
VADEPVIGEPLTDDEVRKLGYEPGPNGWSPIVVASAPQPRVPNPPHTPDQTSLSVRNPEHDRGRTRRNPAEDRGRPPIRDPRKPARAANPKRRKT